MITEAFLKVSSFIMGNKHCTKMMFSIKDFFSKCDQIRRFLGTSSHLLKKFLMKNFFFCAVIKSLLGLLSFRFQGQ